MKKILIIISSKEGKSELEIKKEDILRAFEENYTGYEVQIEETLYKGHIEKLIEDFDKENIEDKNAIICGGDGSLNELANACFGKDIAIGLIPTGTGNDFAKNFDYSNFDVNSIFKFTKKPIDLILINDKLCVNVTSLGFDTHVLNGAYEILDKDPSVGKRAYIYSVMNSLKEITYEHLEIDLKDLCGNLITIKGEYLISALCNGSYYGSGFNPAPLAKINDGYVNLITASKIPFYKLPNMIIKYKNGNHQKSPYLNEYKTCEGIIRSTKPFLANIDGEIFETDKIEFKVLKKAINWIYFNKNKVPKAN